MLFLGWGGCSGESTQKGLKGELKTVRFNHGAAILKLHHGCWRVSSPRGRPWMTGVLPGCQLRKASSWGAAHRATELRRRSISAFLARTCFWLDTETPAWSPTCSKWLVDCPESNPTAFSGDSSPAVDFLRGSLKAIQIRLLPTVRVMAGLLLGMVPTDGGQNYQAWDFSSPSDVLSLKVDSEGPYGTHSIPQSPPWKTCSSKMPVSQWIALFHKLQTFKKSELSHWDGWRGLCELGESWGRVKRCRSL